ncbi:hypothetical protein, partial [Streptantibioticus silvisoli]
VWAGPGSGAVRRRYGQREADGGRYDGGTTGTKPWAAKAQAGSSPVRRRHGRDEVRRRPVRQRAAPAYEAVRDRS